MSRRSKRRMRFNWVSPLAFLRDNLIVAILAIPFAIVVSWYWVFETSWWVPAVLYIAILALAYVVCCAESRTDTPRRGEK